MFSSWIFSAMLSSTPPRALFPKRSRRVPVVLVRRGGGGKQGSATTPPGGRGSADKS